MSTKPSILGRGLNDLIEEVPVVKTVTAPTSGGFMRIPINTISLAPWQRERNMEQPSYQPIVESVKQHGVLQPVLVRKKEEGYELISGALRLQASRAAGLLDIPAVIMNKSDHDAIDVYLIENLQRENSEQCITPFNRHVIGEFTARDENQLSEHIHTICLPHTTATNVQPSSKWSLSHIWTYPYGLAAAGVVVLLLLSGSFILGSIMGKTPITPSQTIVLQPAPPAPSITVHDTPELLAKELPATPLNQESTQPSTPSDPNAFTQLRESGIIINAVEDGFELLFEQPVFISGAHISPLAKRQFKQMGILFEDYSDRWSIAITGHTDPDPLDSDSEFSSNYDLGMARALNVAEFLSAECGIPQHTLSVHSLGADDPPFPNDTAASRRKNRTVTLDLYK